MLIIVKGRESDTGDTECRAIVDSVERIALHSISPVSLFRRYVDDCFALVKTRAQAEALFNALNNVDNNIKFEIEFPAEDGSLSLLDFRVSVSNNRPIFSFFSFYRKSARKNLFVHFRSHLPSSTKRSIILNERKRITDRCSLRSAQSIHLENFNQTLKVNGYPDRIIHEARRPTSTKHPSAHKPIHNDIVYIKLPFISDDVDYKIKRIFKQEGVNLRISHRTHSLRNHLQRTRDTHCSLSNCVLRTSNTCHRRYVVYKVVCRKCQKFYIGSTIRFLHLRIREHMTAKDSSVYKHLIDCSGNLRDPISQVDVRIIGCDHDEANLRLRESILISRLKPQLNSRSEMEAYREFLYL